MSWIETISANLENPELRVISLGVGVQSSTMALMAAVGELKPMPDCAIFSDTMAEPKAVYKYLSYLEPLLPFPVYVVKHKEGLRKNIIDSVKGGRFAGAPFFTESKNGGGMLRRQCTNEFKIQPIRQKIRSLLGLTKGQRGPKVQVVEQWIGISLDELQRAKLSRDKYIGHRYPLLEREMTRGHCKEWILANGFRMPPRSACTFCPYHDDSEWSCMKENDYESFEDAIYIDELIRDGVRGTQEKLYLHRSLTPLKEVDFRTAEQFGQINFLDECEGMCGL